MSKEHASSRVWVVLTVLLTIEVVICNTCSSAVTLQIPSTTTADTTPQNSFIPPTCFPSTWATKGLWYRIAPSSHQLISISTCGACFDTAIALYGPGCSEDSCLLYSDDSLINCSPTTCLSSADHWSSVSFCATESEYFVYVFGLYVEDFGQFDLIVENNGPCSSVVNGVCSGATAISQFPAQLTFTISGIAVSNIYCQEASFSSSTTTSTVWYHVLGTGASFVAHTCDSALATELGLLRGSCSENICVAGNYQDSAVCPTYPSRSAIQWCSSVGESYYLFISGYQGATGSGTLTVEVIDELCDVAGSSCYNPIVSTLAYDYYQQVYESVGSGVLALNSTIISAYSAPSCTYYNGPYDGTIPGTDTKVWYSVEGTGTLLYASLAGSDYDTVLSIYGGTCDNLYCVAANDDAYYYNYDPDEALAFNVYSTAFFCTEPGAIYSLAIGGYGTDSGNYEILIYDTTAPCTPLSASDCSEATPLDMSGPYEKLGFGTLLASPLSNRMIDSCPDRAASLKGTILWFTFEGSYGVENIVSTCNSCVDTVLQLFTVGADGLCDSLQCQYINDDESFCRAMYTGAMCSNAVTSALSVCTKNETYYVAVTGYNGAYGDVLVQVFNAGNCLPNDDCSFANEYTLGTVEIVDLSYGETSEDFTCNGAGDGLGSAWYSFAGTGSTVQLLFCTIDIVGAEVLVVSSSTESCSELDTCVDGFEFALEYFYNYYYGLYCATRQFCTDETTYWLSVGSSDTVGPFLFEMFDLDDNCVIPRNSICPEAESLDLSRGTVSITGDTSLSTGDLDLVRCGFRFRAPHYSWYTVVGIGRVISVSACGSEFDTVIGVFDTSCGDNNCVASNDDFCDTQSTVEFCGLTDVRYYILLGGWRAEAGAFTLHIQNLGLCTDSSVCLGSTGIDEGVVETGSTADPVSVDLVRYQIDYSCATDSPLVSTKWYHFVSQQDVVVFFDAFSNRNLVLALYALNPHANLCSNLICLGGTDEMIPYTSSLSYLELSMCGEHLREFYIMVAGYNDHRVSFSLVVTYDTTNCMSNAVNTQSCDQSNRIPVFPFRVYGNTQSARTSFATSCSGQAFTGGFMGLTWYSVVGTGNLITIDSCDNPADYNLRFILYTGRCSTPQCLSDSGSECSFSFCSLPGQPYYILMGSSGYTRGDYTLDITENGACTGPPAAPAPYTSEKTSSMFTFAWDVPYSYGFAVTSYTYSLFSQGRQIATGTTTSLFVSFTGLSNVGEYTFTVSATSQWGTSVDGDWTDSLFVGDCFPAVLGSLPGDFQLYYMHGNLLTPSESGVLHSLEVKINVYYDTTVELILFASSYEFPDKFVVANRASVEIDFQPYLYFSDLEWDLCESKRYFFAITGASLYKQDGEALVLSCFGSLKGIQVSQYPDNYERNAFWLTPFLEHPAYAMRLDISTVSLSTLPHPPTIQTIYATYNTLALTWDEPCSQSPVVAYEVLLTPGPLAVTVLGDEFSFTYNDLQPGVTYTAVIRALNWAGLSQPSAPASATTSLDRYRVNWLAQSGGTDAIGETITYGNAVDSDGNNLICGTFNGISVFGTNKMVAPELTTDGFVAKYDRTGNLVWVAHIGRVEGSSVVPYAVAANSKGEVFVVGYFQEKIKFDDTSYVASRSHGCDNVFVAKYSSTGQFLFAKHAGDTYGKSHQAWAVTVDSQDRLIVVGTFPSGTGLEFYEDGVILYGSAIQYYYELDPVLDTWVGVWDSDGVIITLFNIYGDDYVYGEDVVVDSDDNIYITGLLRGTLHSPLGYLDSYNPNKRGCVLFKYSPAFDLIWVVTSGGDKTAKCYGVDVGSETVAITGVNSVPVDLYLSSLTYSDETSVPQLLGSFADGPILYSFDLDGNLNWVRSLSPESADAVSYSVSVLPSGLVVQLGHYSGELVFDASYHDVPFIQSNQYTVYLAAFSTDGELAWARWAGSQWERAYGFDIANHGNDIFITGTFYGSAAFDCSRTVVTNQYESYLAKFSPPGTIIPSPTQSAVECGQLLFTEKTGGFRFPANSIDPYPNNIECLWVIRVEDVPHILVTITNFDLADSGDELIFYDGVGVDAPIIRSYNADNAFLGDTDFFYYDNYVGRDTFMVQSSGPTMLIQFKSGDCFRGVGFALNYESSARGGFCDGRFPQIFTLQSGTISQSQDGGYLDNSDCYFSISPEFDISYIVVNFRNFQLAYDDSLTIYDGFSTDDPVLVSYTGISFPYGDLPPPVQSSGRFLLIHFYSSSSEYDRGFVLNYEGFLTPQYCVAYDVETQPTGWIRSHIADGNYLPSSQCSWRINPDDHTYDSVYLYFSNFSVPVPGAVQITEYHEANHQVTEAGELNNLFISLSPDMSVNFTAAGTSSSGFAAQYCARPRGGICQNSAVTTNDPYTFSNQICGSFYESNAQCDWTYSADDTTQINYMMLTFSLVDFVNSNAASPTDYIDVNVLPQQGTWTRLARLSTSVADFNPRKPPTFIAPGGSSFKVQFRSDSLGSAGGFIATGCVNHAENTGCSGDSQLVDDTGEFSNLFCGGLYGANANCRWTIDTSLGRSAMVVLSHMRFPGEVFDYETGYQDNLFVYENQRLTYAFNAGGMFTPDNMGDPVGTAFSDPVVLSFADETAALNFVSDDTLFARGFRGTYCLFQTMDKRLCSGNTVLSTRQGVIDNQACGGYYQANADCATTIQPIAVSTDSYDVVLFITSLDFANPNDKLKVFDGTEQDDAFLLAAYSQPASHYEAVADTEEGRFPKVFVSSKARFTLNFTSDDTGFGQGFTAQYCSVPAPARTCGGGQTLTANQGNFPDFGCAVTYWRPMECSWTVSPAVQDYAYLVMVITQLDIDAAEVTLSVLIDGEIYATSENYQNNRDLGTQLVQGSAVIIEGSASPVVQFSVSETALLQPGWNIEYLTTDDSGICSGEQLFTDPSGYISDHVYGRFYQNNQLCEFLIEIDSAERIAVQFEKFYLEEGYDFLEVYDGSGINSELIGVYTGKDDIEPFVSTTNALYFIFRTDDTTVRSGFRLFYSDIALLDCPLFCSGRGTCQDNVCQCDPGRYGSGCEIPPAPFVKQAIFTDGLEAVQVTFSAETNRANMFGSISRDCSILFAPSSVSTFGNDPSCTWVNNQILDIRFGSNPTLYPGDVLHINPDLIQASDADSSEYPVAGSMSIQVEPPKIYYDPIIIIVGPTVVQQSMSIKLDATASLLSGCRALTFHWNIVSICHGENLELCETPSSQLLALVHSTTRADIEIPASYLNHYNREATFLFTCSATNFLGVTATPVQYRVRRSAEPVPVAVIVGDRQQEIKRTEPLLLRAYLDVLSDQLQAIVDSQACPDIVWSWEVFCDTETETPSQCTQISLTSIDSSPDFYVPANTLDYDSRYIAQLTVSMNTGTSTQIAVEHVIIVTEPFVLDVQILGGTRRDVSYDNDISLQAALTDDQTEFTNLVTYEWACRSSSGYICQTVDNNFLELPNAPTAVIPGQSLPAGNYIFYVVAEYDLGASTVTAIDSVEIQVLRRAETDAQIIPQTVVRQYDQRKPVFFDLQLDGPVNQIRWSVVAGNLELNSNTLLTETSTGTQLGIAPGILEGGATYRFAVNTQSDTGPGFAEIEIQVNAAPNGGLFTVTPYTGTSTNTLFTFHVTGCSDDRFDLPIRYIFGIQPVTCRPVAMINGECPFIPISNQLDYPKFSAYLPPGEYRAFVDVLDRHGATSRLFFNDFPLHVTDSCPATDISLRSFLSSTAQKANAFLCLGNLDRVRQLVNLGAVSLQCARFEVSQETYNLFYTDLASLLTLVDQFVETTQIYLDNRLKSLFLVSGITNAFGPDALSNMLQTASDLTLKAGSLGFLRSDSANAMLNGLSNFLESTLSQNDVGVMVGSVQQLANALLLNRNCDNVPSSVSSTNIRVQSRVQTTSTLLGQTLGFDNGASFQLPNGVAGMTSDCVSYNLVDFGLMAFNDGVQTTVSTPATLTIYSGGEEFDWSSNSQNIEIRIPVSPTDTASARVCGYWSVPREAWQLGECEYIGIRNGYYVMETPHLTTFSVLLGGFDIGGSTDTLSVTSFGSFASGWTGATELFGTSNLNPEGHLKSSFDNYALIPPSAFATSNPVYDVIHATTGELQTGGGDEINWNWSNIATITAAGAAIVFIVIIIGLSHIPSVRNRISGKAGRTSKNDLKKMERKIKRMHEAESLVLQSRGTTSSDGNSTSSSVV